MSQKLRFATVDVFTAQPLSGNQLGVVLVPSQVDEDSLSYDLKLRITKEFNYSETVFIHPFDTETSSRRVDIFTPVSEIPFAGHPTIGAVHYVLENLSPEKDGAKNECLLQLKAGQVTGRIDRATGFASAEIPHDVHIHETTRLDWATVLDSQPKLGAVDVDPALEKTTHALVSCVNGMNFAVIDLTAQPDQLARVEIVNRYVATAEDLDQGWRDDMIGSLFFVRKPDQGAGDSVIRIEQRVIVIGLEDPATGSASSALCAWIALREGGRGSTYRFELEQGTQMGRKSVIGCEVTLSSSGTEVDKILLSGQVAQVMNGEMCV